MHQSKAVPPRFKEHTKLVCARHVRAGRKKYIKKHPERQRKVPSRKVGDIIPVVPTISNLKDSRLKGKAALLLYPSRLTMELTKSGRRTTPIIPMKLGKRIFHSLVEAGKLWLRQKLNRRSDAARMTRKKQIPKGK